MNREEQKTMKQGKLRYHEFEYVQLLAEKTS